MHSIKVKAGQKFGRLAILCEAREFRIPSGKFQRAFWVKCACGKKFKTRLLSLRHGHTKSCGCLKSISAKVRPGYHGMQGTKTYRAWAMMMNRCSNPNCKSWKNYGGRGIVVCDKWKSFKGFLKEVGIIPVGLSLDRLDTNGHYEPRNVRFATWKQQECNRRNNHRLTIAGVTKCLAEWGDISGVNSSTILARLVRGVPAKEAVFLKPAGTRKLSLRQPVNEQYVSSVLASLPNTSPPSVQD